MRCRRAAAVALGALAVALLALVAACTADEEGPNTAPAPSPAPPSSSPATEPPTAPAPVTPLPDDAPRHDGGYLPAVELAALLDCPEAVPIPPEEVGLSPGEPAPALAVGCATGAGAVRIHEYARDGDVDAVLEALRSFCGTYVVGERWTASGDVPAAATYVQGVLGGRVVTLDGCAPGR